MMQAYEFQSNIRGGFIQIPSEFINKVTEKVRVIILSEEFVERENREVEFNAMSLDTRGFVFSREEANER